jgi:hypothetical protein
MPFNLKTVPNFPTKHAVITPSDTVKFQWPTTILCTVAGGNVTCLDEDGNSVTYPSVPAYYLIPVTVSQVMATGTTATGLIAIYGDA